MTEYRVTWKIDVEADSHEAAAQIALDVQRDSASTATVFIVRAGRERGVQIDLDERLRTVR
jgi:hypothetical protein